VSRQRIGKCVVPLKPPPPPPSDREIVEAAITWRRADTFSARESRDQWDRMVALLDEAIARRAP
jgi:hypothetical protein